MISERPNHWTTAPIKKEAVHSNNMACLILIGYVSLDEGIVCEKSDPFCVIVKGSLLSNVIIDKLSQILCTDVK